MGTDYYYNVVIDSTSGASSVGSPVASAASPGSFDLAVIRPLRLPAPSATVASRMVFPFGRPILVMILCSLSTGLAMLLHRAPDRVDLTLWVSVDSHARMYRGDGASASLLENFREQTDKTVKLNLIAPAALDVRLLSLFMFADGDPKKRLADASAPDLVEVDIGSIGKYFRPPVEEVGFVPLNDYLQRTGWISRIVRSRFSPWTKNGVIFGISNDLHPCTLTYRKDLFDQAGIDLSNAPTWSDLQARCLAFQKYWLDHGHPRMALGLSSTAPDMLLVMLRQQHVQLVDESLVAHLTDSNVAQTLLWYTQAVAGPNRIATDLNPAPGQNARDLADGDICGLITPDWMIGDLKQYGPDLTGKLAMIPLPRFHEDDARTASWGGTMIGITRTCKDRDLAWKLIESLYLDRTALSARQAATNILPPIPEYWSDSVYHTSDIFFMNQRIDELYIALAEELPPATMTPYSVTAQTYLTIAMNRTISQMKSKGALGLDAACRQSLSDAQSRVTSMIRFDGASQ